MDGRSRFVSSCRRFDTGELITGRARPLTRKNAPHRRERGETCGSGGGVGGGRDRGLLPAHMSTRGGIKIAPMSDQGAELASRRFPVQHSGNN